MTLQVNSKFEHNYAVWTVLSRHENYVMLQGYQAGIPDMFMCANVLSAGTDYEVCQPNFQAGDPNSACWSLEKMKVLYDEQCALIDKRKAARQTAFEAERLKDKARKDRLAKVSDAHALKKTAQAALKEIIYDGKAVKTMVKSSKVKELMTEIEVCNLIISTLI
jgi:hypothetical protein